MGYVHPMSTPSRKKQCEQQLDVDKQAHGLRPVMRSDWVEHWPGACSLHAALASKLEGHHGQSEACGSALWSSRKLMATHRLDLEQAKHLRQVHRALVTLMWRRLSNL